MVVLGLDMVSEEHWEAAQQEGHWWSIMPLLVLFPTSGKRKKLCLSFHQKPGRKGCFRFVPGDVESRCVSRLLERSIALVQLMQISITLLVLFLLHWRTGWSIGWRNG